MGEIITVKKINSTPEDCTDRSRSHVRSLSCLQYFLARLNYNAQVPFIITMATLHAKK